MNLQQLQWTVGYIADPEMDSDYTYLCRLKKTINTAGMRNV